MKQEFFTDTIQGKFIKSLLKSSYLPSIDSCRDGDYLIKDRVYAYKNKIIKCNKSGFIGHPGEIKEKIKIYQLSTDSNENGLVYSTKLPIDESMPVEIIGNPEVKSDGGMESIDAEVSGEGKGEVALVNVESKESLISDISISVDGNITGSNNSDTLNRIEVVEIGKNWFEKKATANDTFIFGYHINVNNGKLVENSSSGFNYMCTKEFIRVCPNTTYTFTYKHWNTLPTTYPGIFQYGNNNNIENNDSYKGVAQYATYKAKGNMFIGTFTTSEDCFFLMINLPSIYEVSTLNSRFKLTNLQIELGEESTNLEEYFLASRSIENSDERFSLEYDEAENNTTIEFPVLPADAGVIIYNKVKNVYLNVIKNPDPQYIEPTSYSYNKISYYSSMYTNTQNLSIRYINTYPFLPDCNFKTKIKDKNTLIIKVEDGQSMVGDTNKDGILNSEDISFLKKYISGGQGIYGDQIDTRPYHANYLTYNNAQSIGSQDTTTLRRFLGAADKDYPIVQNDNEIVLIYYTPALLETEYDVLKEYEIFKKTPETQSFVSVENYYDDLTHKRLGKFLRYKRDIEDLDLMPFYNCFCGKWVSEYIIDDNFKVKKSNISTSNKKCALVPIKFNRKYKIAAECNSNIRIVPIIMKDGLLQKANINFQSVDLTEAVNKIENSHLLINDISFEFPIEYSLNTFSLSSSEEELISKYENYLYILIEITKDISTSIVVLEGTFNTSYIRYVLDYNSERYQNTNRFFDNICLSNLSLLRLSDGKSYPFSDRLIEFLLLNVIDNKDTNSNNILLMQNNSNIYKNSNRNLGMYMDYYRRAIYNNISKSSLYTIKGSSENSFFVLDDITGFVDKDVEKYLKNGGV